MNIKIKTKKILELIPGPIFGQFSFGFAILSHILGLLFYQEYDIFTMAVSELSNGELGWIYRLGLIFAAFFSIPFTMYLYRTIESKNQTKFLKKALLTTGLIYGISIFFIGLFWKENVIAITLHAIFALTAWIDGFLFTLIFSILMFFDSKYSRRLAFFGFAVSGAFLAHLILLNPISQWVMTLGMIFWIWIVSSYILFKKI